MKLHDAKNGEEWLTPTLRQLLAKNPLLDSNFRHLLKILLFIH